MNLSSAQLSLPFCHCTNTHTHTHPAENRACRVSRDWILTSCFAHKSSIYGEWVKREWKRGEERGKTGILMSQEMAQCRQTYQELQNISNDHPDYRQMVLYKLDPAAIPVKFPISPANLNHHFEYWWHLSGLKKIRLLVPYLDLKLSSRSESISRQPKENRSH